MSLFDTAVQLGAVFGVIVSLMFVAAVLQVYIEEKRSKRSDNTQTRREKLQRNSEYVEVVEEDPESGYGLAMRDSDDGVELVSFDAEDEIYQRTWVGPSELAGAADALSVKACEKEREF